MTIEPIEALLPPVAREIADAIGFEAATRLIEHWGGTRLCVPHRLDGEHELARILGREAASGLVTHYRGETIQVPRAAAAMREALYRQIVREYDGGEKTARQLAREHRVTERWIYYLVARARQRQPSPQTDLF